MGDITSNFSQWEFWSPDKPGESHISLDFVQNLQLARNKAKVAFVINSGWRTPEHHEELYKARTIRRIPDSAHLDGEAADIHTGSSYRAYKMVKALLDIGFPRIIVYSTFVHVDWHPDASRFPRPMLKRGAY